MPGLVLVGGLLFLMFCVFALITGVILVLTKDLDRTAADGAGECGRHGGLAPAVAHDEGRAGGVRPLLPWDEDRARHRRVSLLIAIATAILGVIIAIPSIGLGLLALLTGKAEGLTWNVSTITLAVVVGCLLLGAFLYLVSLLSVPVIVFFPAYSMYFFAARYPQLAAVLYPAVPAGPVAGSLAR